MARVICYGVTIDIKDLKKVRKGTNKGKKWSSSDKRLVGNDGESFVIVHLVFLWAQEETCEGIENYKLIQLRRRAPGTVVHNP